MDGRMAAAVAVFVLTASAVAAVPVGGTPSDEARTFGATISSFMQSSAAETQGSVENEMWSAEFEDASSERQEQMVQSRSGALERKVDRLEAERSELLNGSDDGLTPKERVKAARLAARIESLNDAIEDTQNAAKATGVDLQQLDKIRTEAENLSGPEVAEIARGQASRKGNAGSPTRTDGGILSDIPGIGDDGPPGQRDKNGTADATDDGNASGESDRRNGNNASEDAENDSGNSSQKRSSNTDESAENGSKTPTPESNNTDTQRDQSATREGNRSEGNENRSERNGRNGQRDNSTSEDENAASGDQNSQ